MAFVMLEYKEKMEIILLIIRVINCSYITNDELD